MMKHLSIGEPFYIKFGMDVNSRSKMKDTYI